MALPAAILYLALFIACGCALARLCLCRAGVSASAMAVAGLSCAFGTALLAMWHFGPGAAAHGGYRRARAVSFCCSGYACCRFRH